MWKETNIVSDMNKLASKLLDKAKDFIEENPGIITGLAATGGLGALGGAALTDVDENDSASEKFKKRLKNALLAGGLASAAFGAGSYGINKLKNALPENDESPMHAAIHSSPVRLLGLGAGTAGGLMMQNKNNEKAIKQVFGDLPMSKTRLVEVLNDPANNVAEKEIIEKAWGKDTKALREWITATGVNPTAINDTKLTGIDDTTEAIKSVLGKNKNVAAAADKLKINPASLAKAYHLAKTNKLALGLAGGGLLLPETISAVGNAVGSMFGSSLHE